MALAIRTPPDVVGGFVAMRFAALHPELVKRLLLLVSAHRFSPAGWPPIPETLRRSSATTANCLKPISKTTLPTPGALSALRSSSGVRRIHTSTVPRPRRQPASVIPDYCRVTIAPGRAPV